MGWPKEFVPKSLQQIHDEKMESLANFKNEGESTLDRSMISDIKNKAKEKIRIGVERAKDWARQKIKKAKDLLFGEFGSYWKDMVNLGKKMWKMRGRMWAVLALIIFVLIFVLVVVALVVWQHFSYVVSCLCKPCVCMCRLCCKGVSACWKSGWAACRKSNCAAYCKGKSLADLEAQNQQETEMKDLEAQNQPETGGAGTCMGSLCCKGGSACCKSGCFQYLRCLLQG